ncbi:endonuclease/exonuclease/phosphatase family protein [Xylariaceae sp. FL0804]|nr:endonuclease/exonuclease/phosphatase family protein [Xylariaceae sp. FL0804]
MRMEEVIEKVILRNAHMRKPSTAVPWKPDEPYAQAYYNFNDETQAWEPHDPATAGEEEEEETPPDDDDDDDSYDADAAPASEEEAGEGDGSNRSNSITRLALLSWNIDYMLPYPRPRMEAALGELEARVAALTTATPAPAQQRGRGRGRGGRGRGKNNNNNNTAVVVFLQECLTGDLRAVAAAPWVRRRFRLTDVDAANWASGHYGTTTLVDRRLPVARCFRVHYAATRMERDAFFVDVRLGGSGGGGKQKQGKGKGKGRVLRLCNTHLESLALEPPYRPLQMKVAAAHMHGVEGVHGALVAGDFNAIQPFDRALHEAHGLRDAYLELRGREDVDEGYTWGQQAARSLRAQFGCARMDKLYYCGAGVRLESFARFGAGVELRDADQRAALLRLGFDRPWITDHLGIMAEIPIGTPYHMCGACFDRMKVVQARDAKKLQKAIKTGKRSEAGAQPKEP